MTQDAAGTAMDRLLEVMDRLRDPENGCPWDLEQTFRTIAPYTIEEAHEVADAIERGDLEHLQDELGDLLFQVVFHARLGREIGAFSFDDVAAGVADKLIRRHPHVFGPEADKVATRKPDGRPKMDAETQTANWEEIKAAEREAAGMSGHLDGVLASLPPLRRAVKLQKRAGRAGFDWPTIGPVFRMRRT